MTDNLVTVDSVVRAYILENNLVWHDYFRLLSVALSGLKDLAKDLDVSQNVKFAEIEADETGSAILPNDLVEITKLAIPNGDKLLPIPIKDSINPVQLRNNEGDVIRRNIQRPEQFETVAFLDVGYYYTSQFNDKAEYTGGSFGAPSIQSYGYRRVGNRIQFDTKVLETCFYIVYTTNGVSCSDRNLVHPYAEETLKLWMKWKYPEMQRKGIWENQNEKKSYYTSKRNLQSALNGFGYEEYMRTIREHQVMTARL